MNLKNKNLLVISSFPDKHEKCRVGTFIKEQVNLIKDYFNEVIVIDTVPFAPEFMVERLPKKFKYLQPLLRKKNYSYDNVRVFYPRFLTLPFKKELFDIIRIKSANDIIKKHNINFDLIHASFVWPGGYIGAKLKENYKKPLIVSVRGDPFRSLVVKTTEYMYTRSKDKMLYALKSADKIDTPHPELYDYLCSLGFKEKSELIYKHIDLKKFGNIEKYKKRVLEFKKQNNLIDKKVVLFLANIYPPKDPLTFVRCIPKVVEKNKDVVFLIVGDGVLMLDVLNEIKKLKIEDYCCLTGQIANTHIAYLASDIFCAISPVENIWSSTVMEALASGTPSIITRAGTTEKYLEHKKTAYLIKPQSPQQLADAILELLSNEKLMEKISIEGKKLAMNNWDMQKISERWVHLYSSLV